MNERDPQPERGRWSSLLPSAGDLALTLGLLVVGVLASISHHDVLGPLLSAALVLPLAWRRRWPFAVLLVIAGVAFVQWLTATTLLADVALLVALYTVAAQSSRDKTIAAFAIVVLGIVLAGVKWPTNQPLVVGALLTVMAGAAVVTGNNVSTRRAYLASLEDRAARLEHERDQQMQLAAAAERSRIAREMHDVVAHNLSVMIALADGAGYVADEEPQRASGAMAQVSATGRQALAEMRRLLGVLREGEGDLALAPQPGLAQIEPLTEQVRAAGLPVRLETSGTPAELGQGAELTVFRLVQEALTNTLKHADPEARATVRLNYEADAIEVEVLDDGKPAEPAPADAPSGDGGQGLAGMRERVAVYGGDVEAGPRVDGGWRVHARLTA